MREPFMKEFEYNEKCANNKRLQSFTLIMNMGRDTIASDAVIYMY